MLAKRKTNKQETNLSLIFVVAGNVKYWGKTDLKKEVEL